MASPACGKDERVAIGRDGSNVHLYGAYAPSVSRAELQRRFKKVARRLGYSATLRSGALGFHDEAKRLAVELLDNRVSVLFARAADGPRSAAPGLAKRARLDAAIELDRALGEGTEWKSVTYERLGGDSSLDVLLVVPPAKLPLVETWAKKRKLTRDGNAWRHDYDPASPGTPTLVVVVSHDGRVMIRESRKDRTAGDAVCNQAPGHGQEDRMPLE